MRYLTRLNLYAIMIVLLLALSAVTTVPAYADGETPPTETPAATEPQEPPAQDSGGEEAGQTPLESAPVSTEAPLGEVVPLLADIPEGTEVVVLDDEGEAIPLASQEAVQAIVTGDPIWCPVGVAMPVANTNGCSGSYSTFAALLADPLFAAGGPAKDGVIWIEGNYLGGYNGNDNSTITLNGSLAAFSVMKNFKLTLKGGWNGIGTNTVNPLTPSTFDVPLNILNWGNDVTLSDILFTGITGTGVTVSTSGKGSIVFTNVKSNSNAGSGAVLDTTANTTAGSGNVTITNSQFNSNTSTYGLWVKANGIITLKDVSANGNAGSYGAYLDNTFAAAVTKAIIINGTNTFNNNASGTGLYVYSRDTITTNNITANNNVAGTVINNSLSLSPKKITMNGVNTFNQNSQSGLNVYSNGQVVLNDITANGNTSGNGLTVQNDNAGAVGGVTLTGMNQFDGNNGNGLQITSYGAILASNLIATNNSVYGATLDNSGSLNPQVVTLSGTNLFKFNSNTGLRINSKGQITANNVSANNNAYGGASLSNGYIGASAGITFTGTNQFNDNTNASGLAVTSNGAIKLNNVSANANDGSGLNATYGVLASPASVTLTGTNTFNDNQNYGLYVYVSGAISLSNVTANSNQTQSGAYLQNSLNLNLPAPVTLSGTNVFNGNFTNGLYIYTYGAVTTNNLTANLNGTTSGSGVDINNSSTVITPFNVTMTGVNTFNGNHYYGLHVISDGMITLSSATAMDNIVNYGVYLENATNGSKGGGINLTGTNYFSGNKQTNLYLNSKGAISTSNITSLGSLTGYGATISNYGSVSPKPVTLNGTNIFNDNYNYGLYVGSSGVITTNNLTANNNGNVTNYGGGVTLDSTVSPASVIVKGTNLFNGNYSTGLTVYSAGTIMAGNVTANNSVAAYGVYLDNSGYPGYYSVTLSGTNSFTGNKYSNLYIQAAGAVNLSNITSASSINNGGAYIYNAYDAAKPQAVTISGTNSFIGNNQNGLDVYSYGAITLNNATATGNNTSGSSDSGVYLDNYNYGNSAIPSAVTLTGVNNISSNTENGLTVRSLGTVTINNLTANDNTLYGARINTDYTGASGNVTFAGTSSFSGNGDNQLSIQASGAVLLNNITASNGTGSASGAMVNNTFGITPKPVTLTGVNVFNNNPAYGLYVSSNGAITTNNLTANNNGNNGVKLDNSGAPTTATIVMKGVNTFNANAQTGLIVTSKGAITANSLSASGNTGNGASLNNDISGSVGNIVLTGVNTFNTNNSYGLYVLSYGAISLSNLNADGNVNQMGAYVDNFSAATPKPVTLSGTSVFTNNHTYGLYIYTKGVITTSNLTATSNGVSSGYGVSLDNSSGTAAGVIMNGTNTFNGNYGYGLYVQSSGNITLNNLTANNSQNSGGVYLNNSLGGSLLKIKMTGLNTFNGNHNIGLTILSSGMVDLQKINAEANGTSTSSDGVYISTTNTIILTCGSLTNNGGYGINIFNIPSPFVATLQGVISAGNVLGGIQKTGTGTLVQKAGCPLP